MNVFKTVGGHFKTELYLFKVKQGSFKMDYQFFQALNVLYSQVPPDRQVVYASTVLGPHH